MKPPNTPNTIINININMNNNSDEYQLHCIDSKKKKVYLFKNFKIS